MIWRSEVTCYCRVIGCVPCGSRLFLQLSHFSVFETKWHLQSIPRVTTQKPIVSLKNKKKQNKNIQFSSTHQVSKIPDASSLSFDTTSKKYDIARKQTTTLHDLRSEEFGPRFVNSHPTPQPFGWSPHSPSGVHVHQVDDFACVSSRSWNIRIYNKYGPLNSWRSFRWMKNRISGMDLEAVSSYRTIIMPFFVSALKGLKESGLPEWSPAAAIRAKCHSKGEVDM